jgi:cyclophilin family peptidyl-prolyl cis-trans isomerase
LPPSSSSRPQKCEFLNGKHVVFGKVIDGMLTLRKIEAVQTGPNNQPKLVVKITGASASPLIST